MNEILTAKEWLKEEKIYNQAVNAQENRQFLDFVMERYANYKNRILEDKIKEFREFMPDHTNKTKYLKWVYDKHFNIQNK